MTRRTLAPRRDWQAVLASQGYTWHAEGDVRCWNEEAAYFLSQEEAALLRSSAAEAFDLCLRAVRHVARHGLWPRLGVAAADVPLLRASWEGEEPLLLGRFDFLWDEGGQPKLLEFNADGALTLLETALVQRTWLRQACPGMDQFNGLHDALVEAWQASGASHVHCAWRPRHPEVAGTMHYMAGLVREAGLRATLTALHCLAWDARARHFVDNDGEPIECCCKLYPWSWMLREPFAVHVAGSRCRFFEPPWSHLLASKGLLAILWELFPGHSLLMPCGDREAGVSGPVVRKPMHGREGQNIRISDGPRGIIAQTGGDHDGSPMVYQRMVRGGRHDGWLPQAGIWMVGGNPVALGIRETRGLIMVNDSAFVPHAIV